MGAELRTLAKVYAALLGLLALTVAASFLPLAHWSPLAGFGIAGFKTGLIGWFFMDLRRQGWPVRLALLAGAVWLALLITLSLLDLATRGWMVPG